MKLIIYDLNIISEESLILKKICQTIEKQMLSKTNVAKKKKKNSYFRYHLLVCSEPNLRHIASSPL